MDQDLIDKSRQELVEEIIKLRNGIRKHRDATGHDLCWFQPGLWSLLPEGYDTSIEVPDWPQFMSGCVRYRRSLDEQNHDAPRTEEKYEA